MSLQPIIAPVERHQEPIEKSDNVPTSDADAACVALLKGETDLGKSYKAPEPGGHVKSVLQQMGIGFTPPPPDLQVGDPGVMQAQLAKAELMHKSEHMDKEMFTTRELQERAQKRIEREEMGKAQQLGGDGYQPGATDRDTAVIVTTGATAQSFHQVDQDVDSEYDEPEDSIMRREDMVARESQEKYVDYWTNKSLDGIDAMGDFLEKAKYTKRTGSPGNYKYEYGQEGAGESKAESAEVPLASALREAASAVIRINMKSIKEMDLSQRDNAVKLYGALWGRVSDTAQTSAARDWTDARLATVVKRALQDTYPEALKHFQEHKIDKKNWLTKAESISLTPEKARQMLHERSGGHGREITEQQRKFFGHIGGDLPAPGKKVKKSMSEGLDAMGEYLEKAGYGGGLPTGSTMSLKKPKSSKQGGSADGGELAGVGETTSAIGYHPGPGQDSEGQITGSTGKYGLEQGAQLSADDAKDEGQMQPHKKPIETYKSMTPAALRDSVAYETALEVARLRKGPADVRVGADQAASELVKSDGFYTGQSPSENMAITPLISSQKCPGCSGRFSKSLTACPDCCYGQVTHRALPRMFGARTVNDRQPLLRKGFEEADVQVAIVTPVQFHNQGGTVKLG